MGPIETEIAVLRLSRALLNITDMLNKMGHEIYDTGAKPGATGGPHPFSQSIHEIEQDVKGVMELAQKLTKESSNG